MVWLGAGSLHLTLAGETHGEVHRSPPEMAGLVSRPLHAEVTPIPHNGVILDPEDLGSRWALGAEPQGRRVRKVAVAHLEERLTTEERLYDRYRASSSSLVYVDGAADRRADEPASLDLCVGGRWYDPGIGSTFPLPDNGYVLRPGRTLVVETQQRLRLPDNLFGLVTGRGKYIFQGVFVSPGKIDPSFDGHLLIAVYNASQHSVVLKPGDPFCSCSFFDMEKTSRTRRNPPGALPSLQRPRWNQRVTRFGRANWLALMTLAVAIGTVGSLVVAILAYMRAGQ